MPNMSMHRVQEFYTEANAALSSRSASACLAAILKAKQACVNDPDTVLALAQHISSFNVSSSEGRSALESVVIAACTAGAPEAARKYIGQFSPAVDPAQSSRLAVLHGMIHEAQGDHRAAAAAYDAVVAANPAHALAKKRLIACAMARGDARGAAEQLNSFLKAFPSDTEAWTALAELHEADSAWDHARFCYEECAMLSPTTPYFHVKAAEAMLLEHAAPPSRRTDVSAWREKLEGARDHAAHAVHMSGSTYPRACWVLSLACAACALASLPDVKCVAPAAIMRSVANGKLPSGTAFVQQTGHAGASSALSDFDSAFDAAAMAAHSDDNAALLVAAMQGLRDMYADDAFQPSAQVAAAAQRDPVNNSDGTYVVGSWPEAADSLALIASAALAGAAM